jgi:polyhydroxybutyrate depolymerase
MTIPRLLALCGVLLLSSVSCASGSEEAERPAATTTTAAAPTTTTAAPTTVPELPADRPITVHVSPTYEASTAAPLLVLLHGFGTTGEIQNAYLGLEAPVDANGMLYVYPDGTENGMGRQFWNATEACCAGPEGAEVDDSAYLAAVIANVRAQYNVDPRRIFVMGHSNGGFMSYRMACDHADVVAAVTSISGATYADPDDCSPSEPVAALQVHGTDDGTIGFDGGENRGGTYPSAPETVETWAAYNGCDDTPDDPAPPSRDLVADLEPATVTAFTTGCEPGGAAELWTQPEGGHIPVWSPTFATQVVEWLLAHPKPEA